ncbi:meiosis-specific protein PAIR3 isoform X1 [Asparagus officinalis]|uniref:meiosis-specific protein PAIR3 isoform X1 n=1 Tax=Asparagus officinalis TaxID=4686 RepID=UPI00098E72F8|nr:meiosis-specific protein PAIR3 isoform X1 [Asparagus officinalis]XP_020274301.1 meiosis-specific protein PAIR3 isoform X1 [Asparagus officinalis]
MVEIGSQNMQTAVLSDCPSFHSSQHPSGRFPKVSIGITVNKCPKTGPDLIKEDSAVLPAGGRTVSRQAAEEITKQRTVERLKRNKSKFVEDNKASAWFQTSSVQVETPRTDAVKASLDRASLLESEDGVHRKLGTVAYGNRREKGGNIERVEEVAFAAMQAAQLVDKENAMEEPKETTKLNEERVNTASYGKKRENNGDVEMIKEVAFCTKQLPGEEKGKEQGKVASCNSEALKMKLWEILGTAPSGNKHPMNSPDNMKYTENLDLSQTKENKEEKIARAELKSPELKEKKENLWTNQGKEHKEVKASRMKPILHEVEENKQELHIRESKQPRKRKAAPKQHSDTIETDSESPNQAMRRPITRSLTRKKASPKRIKKFQGDVCSGKKPLTSSSSDFNFDVEKSNIFAFEVEGKSRGLGHPLSGQSNRSKEKNNEKEYVKLRKIYFSNSTSEKNSRKSDKEKSSSSPDRASSMSKKKEKSSVPCQNKKQFLQTEDGTQNDSHYSERAEQADFGCPLWAYKRDTCENADSPLLKTKRHSWGCENCSPEAKQAFQHNDVTGRSMGRKTSQLDDFCSPTLAVNISPTSNISRGKVSSSPLGTSPCSSKDLGNASPGSCQSDADTESSDDTIDIGKPRDMESPYMTDEPEKQQSLSPIEEHDTESEVEDLTRQGLGQTGKWFPNTESPKKSSIPLHDTKIIRSLNNVKVGRTNLSPPSSVGAFRSEETIASFDDLEQYPEGSLARCFVQLIVALQKFKARMKSHCSKRKSEILSAAADKIRQQLEDVESQILGDVGKINDLGKSKRKRLESRFQEKQESIKHIHDKFNEEINHHLLDCRSILEDLEACNLELKGTADRQKASHRKLLSQVAEALEAQVNTAETSIAAIRKDEKRKMAGLRLALKEWMGD